MSGKARPSLRTKTLLNVDYSNLSTTDKKCIHEVFERYETKVDVVLCKDCIHWGGVTFGNICRRWSAPLAGMKNCTQPDDFCSCGERKDGAE